MVRRRLNPGTMCWTHKPRFYVINADRLVIETEPHTSMTGELGGSESASGMALPPADGFSLTLRMDYEFHGSQDECGIYLKRQSGRWCKFSIENIGSDTMDIACTMYENGYADRSIREIGSLIHSMYLRIIYWGGEARFLYSFNGDRFVEMRSLHFADCGEPAIAGLYACSPGSTFFDCTFSRMEYSEQKQ
ncbi:MAG: DUF1349 domain-containing protein [Erysipelotrichia bacterium]|nr:DUF1349 domain-containing protein [Erysipelotrichia bacterium]